MCVCVYVLGGREGVGQRKDFFKSSVALKESLYLAGFRGPVNMYFATQTAIAVGAPEKCKEVKEKDNRKDWAI